VAIFAIMVFSISYLFVVGSIVWLCCGFYSQRSCQRMSTRQAPQFNKDSPSRWYDRMRKSSGSSSSGNRNPALVEDVSLENLRSKPGGQALDRRPDSGAHPLTSFHQACRSHTLNQHNQSQLLSILTQIPLALQSILFY
jgi:hypothetical protein